MYLLEPNYEKCPKPIVRAVLWVYLILIDKYDGVLIEDQDGKYSFPFGQVEEGESPLQALSRQIEENIGTVIADELRRSPPNFRHVSHRPRQNSVEESIDLYFVHETSDSKEKVEGENKLAWIYPPLPDNFITHNRVAFEAIFGKKNGRRGLGVPQYSELNIQWLKRNSLYDHYKK